MICGSRSLLATICLVLLASGLAACATNPITGRSQLHLVSEERSIVLGQQAYSSLVGTAYSKGTIVNDRALVDRVHGITDRLVAEAIKYRPETAAWNWEVQVFNKPDDVNAFCFPGGKMGIYTGLIQKLDVTDDEIAQVMAHEVSHALLGHGAEKLSAGLLSSILVQSAAAAGSSNNQRQSHELTADIASTLFFTLPNSRKTEAEADSVGIELAARAGFDPHAAVSLFQKMARESGTGRSKFDWLNSHPATPKRIAAVSEKVDGLMPVYLAASGQQQDISSVGVAGNRDRANPSRQSISLEQMCDMPSRIDRAECMGDLGLGMSQDEITRSLGPPTESEVGSAVVRYDDRYLQFDERHRLVGITESKP